MGERQDEEGKVVRWYKKPFQNGKFDEHEEEEFHVVDKDTGCYVQKTCTRFDVKDRARALSFTAGPGWFTRDETRVWVFNSPHDRDEFLGKHETAKNPEVYYIE